MTSRQREVLVTIHRLMQVRGFTPSCQEVADELNLASLSTVYKHIQHLKRNGYIQSIPNQTRGITLTQKAIIQVGEIDLSQKWREEANKLRAALIEIESGLTTDRVSKQLARIALGWGKL